MADRVQGKPAEAPSDEPPRDVDEPPRDVDTQPRDADSLSGHIDQNIESVVALQRRE